MGSPWEQRERIDDWFGKPTGKVFYEFHNYFHLYHLFYFISGKYRFILL